MTAPDQTAHTGRGLNWDEWRGSIDGRPSMLVKRLFDRWGYRVDLHKFIRADDPDCYHTHPATAVRIILWGGYVEAVLDRHEIPGTVLDVRTWKPGRIGIVRPELCHRIHRLLNGRSSYSLWLRGRKCAAAEIVGAC